MGSFCALLFYMESFKMNACFPFLTQYKRFTSVFECFFMDFGISMELTSVNEFKIHFIYDLSLSLNQYLYYLSDLIGFIIA